MDREARTRFRASSIRACPSKRHYSTWAEARTVAQRARRNDGWDYMEPYRCRCGGYAVGHPPSSR